MGCLPRAFQLLYLVFFFLFNCHANISSSSSSSSSSATHLCSPEEAAALLLFKTSFSIDKYSSWSDHCYDVGYPKTNSWKDGLDCCKWDGVTCDHIKGRVIGLDLSCSQLNGHIPSNSSLFHLLHLQKLNLAFNNFLPSKMSSNFGGFANLLYLNLSGSYFEGQVPSQVSHLSKLVSLDLSWNFDQTLDRDTLQGLVQNLTEVRQLVFDYINMSSINPNALMNLSSSLRTLSLNDCDLRGKFPENIFYLPNLKSLHLASNGNLTLSFPELNTSSNLEVLDLSYNFFLGGLPDSIANLSSLKHLEAHHSNFSGGLPNSIGNLVSLKYLDLFLSNLSGSIPRSFGNLTQLSYLELSWNSLSGQIPSSMTNLRQLEYMSIANNQLEGSIPDEVIAFPNLVFLDLSFNSLNGALPSWLFTIPTLKHIDLYENQLSGNIKEFKNKSLEVISFGNNNLKGPLPSSISQLVNLTRVGFANLVGIVKFEMFSKLQNLQILDLSNTSLSLSSNGSRADYTFRNILSLDLSFCNISEIPPFLRGLKSLQQLDLSNNRIHGKIPKWMWDVGKESLTYLNLAHNSLTDFKQIPWEGIAYLDLRSNLIQGNVPIPSPTANAFFISNNSLSGEIPSLICDAISLQFLDLSRNNLNGIIPQCLGNLSQSLSVLNLRMNQLRGIIPPIFTEGCQLKNLNLNGNQLEGPFAQSIMNCRDLEVLDLGNNMINDTFPHWLGRLPQLQVLVLRSNQLHGSIQDTMSDPAFSKIQIFDLANNYFAGPLPVKYIKNFKAMINLRKDQSESSHMGMELGDTFYRYSIGSAIKGVEFQLEQIFVMFTIIDLSKNKFEGEIPKVVGELKLLKGLNLSHNNLSGRIPTSIGNLIRLEWLDLSSNKLVGKIPRQLTSLASLAVFNLSQNQLVGPIPGGNQFNTFGNESYAGNMGLCGFPLSKSCDKNEEPVSDKEDETDSETVFEWKAALMGYGSGLVFGISATYIMFALGKPVRLVRMVEEGSYKLKRYLRGLGIL